MNSTYYSAPCKRCLLVQCENANGSNKFGTFYYLLKQNLTGLGDKNVTVRLYRFVLLVEL